MWLNYFALTSWLLPALSKYKLVHSNLLTLSCLFLPVEIIARHLPAAPPSPLSPHLPVAWCASSVSGWVEGNKLDFCKKLICFYLKGRFKEKRSEGGEKRENLPFLGSLPKWLQRPKAWPVWSHKTGNSSRSHGYGGPKTWAIFHCIHRLLAGSWFRCGTTMTWTMSTWDVNTTKT